MSVYCARIRFENDQTVIYGHLTPSGRIMLSYPWSEISEIKRISSNVVEIGHETFSVEFEQGSPQFEPL